MYKANISHFMKSDFRFPKKQNSSGFEEVTQHILDSLVDAYVVALKADTKL